MSLQLRRPSPKLPSPGPRLREVMPTGTAECPACGRRMAQTRLVAALLVCPRCHHHIRVPARDRMDQLADPGTCAEVELPVVDHDPLGFDDGVPYKRRLAAARAQAHTADAVVVARAEIGSVPVMLASMEFAFLGGSLGSAAGEALLLACDLAVAEGRGLITVCVSGGARMQEGVVALAQMARCTAGTSAVAAAGLPYISILADPCYGGVTASFATQADVILVEPRARIGFAGGRVIEQATHQRLPEGFQSAEFLVDHGMVDAVVPRPELRGVVATLLGALTAHRRRAPG